MGNQNQPSMEKNDSKLTRRGLLNWFWTVCGIIATAEVGWLGLSFMKSRKKRNYPILKEAIVTAGSIEDFAPGTVTAITSGQFYIACMDDGGILALSRTCTHLGCSVPWYQEKNKFTCPCHGSTFSLTGEVLTAPAPRPLDIYPVRLENGIVKVDISSPQKRERFDSTQVARL